MTVVYFPRLATAIGACALLTSCASVTAVPLNRDGTRPWADWLGFGRASGIRYYLPKPYLLVTELPASPNPPPTSPTTGGDNKDGSKKGNQKAAVAKGGKGGKGGGSGTGGGGTGGSDTQNGNGNQPQTSTPTAAPADTSFSAAMAQYAVKLVYLPDYSQPMALKVRSGLLGTVSAAPTLQDGWMLTSVNGSSASGVPETLQALASIASGVATGGSSAAGGTAAKTAKSAVTAETATTSTDWEKVGEKIGQGLETMPTLPELTARNADMLALAKGIIKGAQVAPLPWGDNVLPAGLYEFHYVRDKAEATATNTQIGDFVGLRPVEYFCKQGVATPSVTRASVTIEGETYYIAAPPPVSRTMKGYNIAGTPCEHDNSDLDEPGN